METLRAKLPFGLALRGAVFPCRRRWSAALVEKGAPRLLRVPLRTEVLLEVMARATALTAAMEPAESKVMSACVARLAPPEDVKAIVDDTIRAAVHRARSSAG